MRRASDTSPGPDGLRYSHLRKFDPGGRIIAAVCNAVHRVNQVPSTWKTSVTVLLPKKGDPREITNWRPITLSNTMGKVYSSVLAARMEGWAMSTGRLTLSQKGFLAYEGCAEHSFLLQSLIQDARRARKGFSVAFLDFTNAFGSVPHSSLWDSLSWLGLAPSSIDCLRRLYQGCTTQIRAQTGLTVPIPIQSGVKQGDPISPILFNLAVEPLIRAIRELNLGYRIHGESHTVLAYADDFAVVSEGPHELQRALNVVSGIANWVGLNFKPAKCASLSFHGATVTRHLITVQGKAIPSMGPDDSYQYLGVPTGHKYHLSGKEALSSFARDLQSIDQSLLAPWQKGDAVWRFLMARMPFHLTNGVVSKTELKELDKEVRRKGKKWMNLPQRASAELVYLNPKQGGLGLLPLADLHEIAQMSAALRLLHCRDNAISTLANKVIIEVAAKRAQRPVTMREVSEYLNGSLEPPFDTPANDASSRWTRLRMAMRTARAKGLDVKWCTTDEGSLTLKHRNRVVRPLAALRYLAYETRLRYLQSLTSKKDQGKVFEVSALSPHSNHFLRSGSFTEFRAWRFIHRARVDTVPLNGNRRWALGDKRCRRCGYENETLPHVLNHCNAHTVEIQARHNALVSRLLKAMRLSPTAVVYTDAPPPLCPGVRPDICIVDEVKKEVTVIDVACPFENGATSLEVASEVKRAKYEVIKLAYAAVGYKVSVLPFVLGSLGAWYPPNDLVLASLQIGPRYAQLFRMLCVSSTISWSRNIYCSHVTGIPQPPPRVV